jgi:HEAT repeat protein
MAVRLMILFIVLTQMMTAQPPAVPPTGVPPVAPPAATPSPPAATPPMTANPPPATTPPVVPPLMPENPPAAVPMPVAPINPTPAAAPAAPTWPTAIGGKDLTTWLKDLVESKDAAIRETAVKAIPLFGPTARGPALKPFLKRLTEETDPGVRMNLILALGAIGAEKPEEAKSICEALNGIILRAGVGSPVRLHATRSLSNYGPAATMAIATMDSISEDTAWETRQAIVMTLGRIGRATDTKRGPSPQALNTLIKRLAKEESAVVRLEIAQSLLLLGPPAFKPEVTGDYVRVITPYLDAVKKRLDIETDDATRVWLLMVNMQYDGNTFNDTTISKIADSLNSENVYARYAALRALALLGEKAKAALPAMINVLRNEDVALVAESVSALAAMKATAMPALPELERIKTTHANEALKTMATEAIDIITGKKKVGGKN